MHLERGIVKACAGIVESANTESCLVAIEQAGNVVGASFAPGAEPQRQRLVEAIKLNLVNRQEYPMVALIRCWELPVSEMTFRREKYRYCTELARLLGLIRVNS